MISVKEIEQILADNSPESVETLAQKAHQISMQYVGKAVSLYTPLYLANYCENLCLYCGFHNQKDIKRERLDSEHIENEMKKIASTGIQSILLLTGESRNMSSPEYIRDAVLIARKYFTNIAIEVYPLEADEYKMLFDAGVEGVTIYQETYDRKRYDELHLKGRKKDYNYRYETPARIAKGGIRMINMGVLLGLAPVAEDITALYSHLRYMEKHYPGVEYSVSFPRLIPFGDTKSDYFEVSDINLFKLIALTRILFPRVGLNLSTREQATFRDRALSLGITRISAASKTIVGGYTEDKEDAPQFDVQDPRSVSEIVAMLKARGYDPVYTDWRRAGSRL